MKVRAIGQGFYQGRHVDVGTIFDVDPKLYAGNDDPDPSKARFGWMEKVNEEALLTVEENAPKPPKKKSIVSKIIGK